MALNHYSHYRNSSAAYNMYEVVSPALFEVYFVFPEVLKQYNTAENKELMFQHVRSISGLDGATPTIGNVVQKFKDCVISIDESDFKAVLHFDESWVGNENATNDNTTDAKNTNIAIRYTSSITDNLTIY